MGTSADLLAHRRFLAVGERLALPADELAPLADELVDRYAEKHRAYHTIAHVLDCLERADEARADLEEPDLVELALWYHDVVYDPRRDDNETRSAVIARERLATIRLAAGRCSRVIELVLATARPDRPPPGDAAFLCDIDFSILGRAWPEYDAYRLGIRAEYAFVPDDGFADGRSRLIERWLARRSLFHTDRFVARYEDAARANLARELSELRAPRGKTPG